MLGIYDYTVILTYLSLLSASAGILVSLSGGGHPFLGVFFLLFCGFCDAFDGKVARTKKNRSHREVNFGIQIDSLSDLVAFGVLPACIGAAMMRVSPLLTHFSHTHLQPGFRSLLTALFSAVLILYVLAAMIRLAYFNVTEEERQEEEGGVRKFSTGLPVTSASLIFPTILLLQYILPVDVTPLYIVTALITGFAFLGKFEIRKPGLRGILIMVGIGIIEFALILLSRFLCR